MAPYGFGQNADVAPGSYSKKHQTADILSPGHDPFERIFNIKKNLPKRSKNVAYFTFLL